MGETFWLYFIIKSYISLVLISLNWIMGVKRMKCFLFVAWTSPCEKSNHTCVLCLSRKMMDVCGEAESRLATELMQHEVQIERDILDPLNQLAEVKALQLSDDLQVSMLKV